MNVTSNGYYTTQYLNQQQRQPRQRVQTEKEEVYQTPRTPHEALQSSSINQTERKPIMRNIRPRHEPQEPSDSFKRSNRSNSNDFIEAEVDPHDQLQEEPTPAELNRILEDGIIITPVVTEPKHKEQHLKQKSRKNNNNDYYLKQKSRYDEAEEVKPTMYTHKTFREVFSDKQECPSKYNPIDTVFTENDDSYTNNKANAKFSAFLKNIKMMKSDYNDYNYYDHRKRKSVGRDVFVSEVNEDECEGDGEFRGQQDVNQLDYDGTSSRMKKSTLKTMWKRKMNRAKKELGRDFDSHLNGSRGREGLSGESITSTIGEGTQNTDQTRQANNEFALTSMVSQGYNYLWTWYDFYQNRNQAQSEEAIPCHSRALVPMTKPQASSMSDTSSVRTKGQRRAKFGNGSKQLLSSWNQPANLMFKNEGSIKKGRRIIYPTKDNSSSLPSREFIVEYDSSDEESMAQELYYNPQTKQLEAQPPTSSQSMLTTTSTTATSKSPSLATVSNLLDLIKRIHIMQLIFTPIDFIAENFPQLQTLIIVLELVLFVWILYELSRLVDALCMMVRAFCSPLIAMGRFMNKIM
ncbi:hypothetical protein I9W82_002458 [Candida metapsilosis]|uniref:Uncharacterized protein n=1 Tax=Candida metapsilosis TaxID=273372 RepID=A0A8H8DCR2_9ASCO|nr:hypothetical protein I9W82_002458 [Candida metapsilosis]